MIKVNDVAQYFLYLDDKHEGEGITNLKLQKLIYYAQGFHSALFGAPLFNDKILAWIHGPVVEDLYHSHKSAGRNPISRDPHFDITSVPKEQMEHIEEIFNVFGQYSAWKLREMTHEEPIWIAHSENAEEIPLIEIQEYFKTRLN